MAKKPIMTEEEPISLISLDPASATVSVDRINAEKADEADFLSEKVMIQFYNIESPGKSQYFCHGPCNDPDFKDTIQHGEFRELTRATIRFIESRQEPIQEYQKTPGDVATGKKPKTKAVLIGWKPRFQCREVRNPKKKVS